VAEEKSKIIPPAESGEKKPLRRAAVAMRYDVDRDKAPMILATGRGPIADEIVRVAEDNKIPLYEDPELAGLLSKLEMDTEVPPELYVLVAEVLFFVFQLDRMAEKKERLITKMREEEKEKKR
jgi:flagellar biosynthesis protein